jgi:hypothetical protein
MKNKTKKPRRPKKTLRPGGLAHSVEAAAYAAGVSGQEMYNKLNAGKIRGIKWGKRTLILDSELRRYLESLPAYVPAHPRAA